MDIGELAYPGRFIILGQRDGQPFAIYGVTARSAASKAKRYVYNEQSREVGVEATDIDVINQGDPDLLLYTAVRVLDNAIIVGNGKQVDKVDGSTGYEASHILSESLSNLLPENDK